VEAIAKEVVDDLIKTDAKSTQIHPGTIKREPWEAPKGSKQEGNSVGTVPKGGDLLGDMLGVPPLGNVEQRVDTLLAAAGAPAGKVKIKSPWREEFSALPWIATRRNNRDRLDALNSMRRRPFRVSGDKGAEKKVENNRDRLDTLWKMSASHGVSWDELDEFYIKFHEQSVKASRNLMPALPHTSGGVTTAPKPSGGRHAGMKEEIEQFKEDQRELIRRKIEERNERGLEDHSIYNVKESEHELYLAVNMRANALAKRKWGALLKRYRQQYVRGRLTQRLRDFVLDKMMTREAMERGRGFGTAGLSTRG